MICWEIIRGLLFVAPCMFKCANKYVVCCSAQEGTEAAATEEPTPEDVHAEEMTPAEGTKQQHFWKLFAKFL